MIDPTRTSISCVTILIALVSLTAPPKTVCSATTISAELVSVSKIWDQAPHNAFTDLVHWRNKFYCAFREGQHHSGDIGGLRIISSTDGTEWQSVTKLEMPDYDLRDAAISVMPDGRLMVLGGAQHVAGGESATGTCVSFSENGEDFTEPEMVIPLGRWLWRVTWHEGKAYGVAYAAPSGKPFSSLHATADGREFETLSSELQSEGGWPTEARLRFTDDGTCYCLHRRDGESGNTALLGSSRPPYAKWSWHDLGMRFGGPNFLQIPSGYWIGVGRLSDGRARTAVTNIDVTTGNMTTLLELPSGGDTSYAGMVWHNGLLYISYYSTHEAKTSIYLAKVRIHDDKPVNVGDRRELFIDRHIVEQLDGTSLRMHHPQPAERVLEFDKPWEGAFCAYATILKHEGRFQMYYRGLPAARRDGTDSESTCYAVSDDGVHWTKPNLGIYEIDGTADNNVVLRGHTPASHNFSPFLDNNPNAAPDERYKALGGNDKGLIAFGSPDGIKWTRIQTDPVFTDGVFDSQNVSFWSDAEQSYVCYFRTWSKGGYKGFRTVSRTTSKDFRHWTAPQAMTFGGRPYEHLYTNQTNPYIRAPHIYIGVAARFMPGRQVLNAAEAARLNVDPGYFGDCSDAVLLTSRGGNAYDRTFMESFIRPGRGLENWVSRTNYPSLGIVETSDDGLSIYLQKNYGQPTAHLQRFTLRKDGFASVNAPYAGGVMLTKPLSFGKPSQTDNGPRELVLNFATSAAGTVRVELQSADGTAITGFHAEDCDPIIGDRISRVVSWQGSSDLSELIANPIRLRFVMQDADLYSIQVR